MQTVPCPDVQFRGSRFSSARGRLLLRQRLGRGHRCVRANGVPCTRHAKALLAHGPWGLAPDFRRQGQRVPAVVLAVLRVGPASATFLAESKKAR